MKQEKILHLYNGQAVSPFESVENVPSIDKTASVLVGRGEYDADVAKYIPGTLELAFQEWLHDIKKVEQVAHLSYKDKETINFQLLLDQKSLHKFK